MLPNSKRLIPICCLHDGVLGSLQCRRIFGGRNIVRVRNIVIAAIFDFKTVEDWGEWKYSSSLRKVSTWRFGEQKHLLARRKRLHCRLCFGLREDWG